MKINPRDNRLYLARGVASRIKGRIKVPVEFIEYNDPECGAYVDARGFVVLPNFNPSSGDQDDRMAILIIDGSIVLQTIDEAITTTCGFANDSDVSATSVVITGCLTGTVLDGTPNTRQLTATVLPSGAVQTGTWTSSVPTRATVNSSGLVTYVGDTAGVTTITFTSTDGGFTATCVITVTEN